MPKLDHSILEMALVGYTQQCRQIETAIAGIQSQLGGRSTTKAVASITNDGPPPKRRMSAAARKRIAAAQKRRWAAFHKAKAQTPVAAKKKLSPARKAALLANLAKARAARAAKRAAAA